MKIEKLKTPMLKYNAFKIENFGDYHEFIVTASEGKNSAKVSFPWHHSLPDGDPCVERAIKISVDRATATLIDYLERKQNPIIRWIKKELKHFNMMCSCFKQDREEATK